MKEFYIFLDWTMTISDLAQNKKLNMDYFKTFVKGIEALEKKLDSKAKLVIVSGCSEKTMRERFSLLKEGFKSVNRSSMFKGIAGEYGGLFISGQGKFYKIGHGLDAKRVQQIMDKAKKFNLELNDNLVYYLNFEGDVTNEKLFALECKKEIANISIVLYNDAEGHGCDIKSSRLTKGDFVKWYFNNRTKPKLLIVGGDDKEDLSMIVPFKNTKVIFLGYYHQSEIQNAYVVKNYKENLFGIIEAFNLLCEQLDADSQTKRT